MIKRHLILILTILLTLPMFGLEAMAAEKKSSTIAIPITTGLIGNNNSAKTFILELPSGVSASAISANSLKYSGSNETVSVALENGKIKVTLKGVANTNVVEVKGYSKEYEKPFTTNIGNSIWRYSDGRRWQINEYNETKDTLDHYDLPASDAAMPSADPPSRVVSAASNQSTVGLIWYASKSESVDSQYVIPSTISINYLNGSSYLHGKPKFKNGKIITNYTIPTGVSWSDQTGEATMPITGWVQGRFYAAFVNYYYLATAKMTTYSYGGKVSFDYELPTEPTLDGSVSVMKPSPNPAKFEGKDTPVSLNVKGDLLAYSNTSNIEEWIFYAKETGSSDVKIKKDYAKVLNSTQTFDNFVIPKSRGSNVKQEYTLTVTVRFTKPVVSSSGTVSSLTKTMKANVEVSANPVDVPSPPVNNNKPPIAILDVSDEVMAGEDTLIYGKGSYDPDGKIVEYKYNTPGAVDPVSGEFGWTWYPLSALGQHSVRLTVTDNGGLTGSTSAKINVIQPVPRAEIAVQGTKKENRKVTLLSKSRSPEHYPIVESKTKWTITPVSGGTAADIKYSGSLTGVNTKDVLFKKAGTYKATITVTNTAGFSDSTSMTFDIIPDESPIVLISVPSKVYRDPADSNRAAVPLTDMSSSPDYDFLAHRLWQYRYDSNNDGNFKDEAWVTISDQNVREPVFKPAEVGRYEIKLTVTEEFDQPTIDEFVTAADRRSADSYTDTLKQQLVERVVEVWNRAPVVDWDF